MKRPANYGRNAQRKQRKTLEPTKPPPRHMDATNAVIRQASGKEPRGGFDEDYRAQLKSRNSREHPIKEDWDTRSWQELCDAGVNLIFFLHPDHEDHERWLEHAAKVAALEESPKWREPETWYDQSFGWSKLGFYKFAVDAWEEARRPPPYKPGDPRQWTVSELDQRALYLEGCRSADGKAVKFDYYPKSHRAWAEANGVKLRRAQ